MWIKKVISVNEAARILRVNTADIQTEIDSGRLHAINVAGKTRILRESWQEYLGVSKNRSMFPRVAWAQPALLLVLLTGVVFAMEENFDFPVWNGTEIPPQEVEFSDPEALTLSDPALYPPINAPLDYRRYNDTPSPPNISNTHMLMSLQLQNNVPPGSRSSPWTLFVNLDTNHDKGDGVASHLRLQNRGSGWAAGGHVDGFAFGTGTTIGYNVEMRDMNDGDAYVIGVNIQNRAWQGDIGMQIQTGPFPESHRFFVEGMDGSWNTGIKLAGHEGGGVYNTGIELGPRTSGKRGIWMRGDYDIGLDLGPNNMRMQGGSQIQLDGNRGIGMRFSPRRNRIEFLEKGKVIAFLNVSDRGVDLAKE
ncbi:MAG: helix-turn-helix domain-containing protein [Xanthomonadales bacterium]|nr:helix-turn-helix domain-containing protein [Xanthomonadales bacterium]